MKHEQIGKYVALINKYQNRKRNKKVPSTLHHHFQIANFSHKIDAEIFKQSIQQKIKTKYRQPKRILISHQPTFKTLELPCDCQGLRFSQKKYELSKEELQKNEVLSQQINIFRKENNMNGFARSKQLFLNTSNLLMAPSPDYLKNRKTMHEKERQLFINTKHDFNIFKNTGQSNFILKKYNYDCEKLQKIGKTGVEINEQIYSHHQNGNTKTVPDELIDNKSLHRKLKTQKDKIVQSLRNKTLFPVKPKLLKDSLTKNKELKRAQIGRSSHNLFKNNQHKKYQNISSERIQNNTKHQVNPINLSHFPRHQRISLFNFQQKHQQKQQTITGWQYDQQS